MSNPIFFTAAGSLDLVHHGATFVLTGQEARHAVTVKRLAVGEPVDIADGHGRRMSGVITVADPTGVEIECVTVSFEAPPAVRLILVQALAKGDRDQLAIETATELGISAVVPWQSERSIVRWKADRAVKAHAKWESVVTAAAKQARRSVIPPVGELLDTGGLASLVRDSSLAVVLHEDAVRPLRSVLESWLAESESSSPVAHEEEGAQILLIVGPEGGISPREVTRLCDAGAVTALIGHHVLRSSTAGPAAAVLANDVLKLWN